MKVQIWQIGIVFVLGGVFIFILISLLLLINPIKKAARQVEIAVANLDNIFNSELRFLLIRGEKVLGELEDIFPLVKDKLTHFPARNIRYAFMGIGGYLERSLIVWILKEACRKILQKKKRIGS
jgi:hypothetical protein